MTNISKTKLSLKSSAFALSALALITNFSAFAEDKFPSKTIEVITHAGAGGGTDVNSRMMMLRGRRALKTDMVVVNKRGGGGALAMNYFLTRPADGHTIMTFTVGHAITMGKGKTKLKLSDMRPLARGTNDPQILILDEFTSFLDKENEFEIAKEIREFRGQKTIIMISHSKEVLDLCDKIIKIRKGI